MDSPDMFKIVVIFLLTISIGSILWMKKKFQYWKKKGVLGPEPGLIFGNIKEMLLLKRQFGITFKKLYEKFDHLPYFGIFMATTPTLVINDPELIKQIMVKDFHIFPGRWYTPDTRHEPLMGTIFNLTGPTWKSTRNIMTPTFSTAKMRIMYETMKECIPNLLKYMDEKNHPKDIYNIKNLMSLLGINITGSCVFGVQCNAFQDQTSPFIKAGTNIFGAGKFKSFVLLLWTLCYPEKFQELKFSIVGKSMNEFFEKLIKDTIEYRKKNNIQRSDFLQMVSEENDKEESTKNKLSVMEIAAQAFAFFVAGFESSSSVISLALYEMALNQKVQNALRESFGHFQNENITYDSLTKMDYLSKVIKETIRKYPPLPCHLRKCAKDYTIPNTSLVIERGTHVLIPAMGIHYNSKYFPDPEKFDPERFSAENEAARNKFTYLPFGEGPRTCVATRFAEMQMRLSLYTLITNFRVSVCEKTKIPPYFDHNSITLAPKMWLKMTKIKRP